MRDLTKEEVEKSPKWADRYMVLACELYFINEIQQARFTDGCYNFVRPLWFDYNK